MLTSAVALTAGIPRKGDFNGDGRSDLLWRNTGTGQVYVMPMIGAAPQPGAMAWTEPSANWQIVGTADLDGDGKSDLVWWNSLTGQVYAMLMDGATVKSGSVIYTEPNINWRIVGNGDLMGAGQTDLLWRNSSTGQVYLLPFNGLAPQPGAVIWNEASSDWQIVATDDFTGDSKADILWLNSRTGGVFLMQTNGAGPASGSMIYTEPNRDWKIVGSGDFNGDGTADILWRNSTSGQVFVMPMANGAPQAGGMVWTEASPHWQIVGTGDYNGDGKADILWWNNQSGQVFQMLMNGLAVNSSQIVYTEPNTLWIPQVGMGQPQNHPPVAVISAPTSVNKQALVTLDGSGSSDPDRDPLKYTWQQTAGAAVTLTNPNVAVLRFYAPSVAGDLQFSLIVGDGRADSQPATAVVQVTDRAPIISSVTLTPAAPTRDTPIHATVVASDPDRDGLTLIYAWKRNGVPLPGATTADYPLGNQAKGDVISLEVSASDGQLGVVASAQVTVADSPATLSATAPATASFGQPLGFQINSSDADGDPVGDFEIEYGPAGFAISATGAVTWTPSGPMFDRTMEVHWAIRLKADPKARVSGQLTLSDPARVYPLVRTNLGIPNNNNCIEIQDFDGDGGRSVLVGSKSLFLLRKAGTDYVQTWAYPFDPGSASGISAVASGDVDQDGHREIFFTTGTVLVALDGANRREYGRFGSDLAAMNGPKRAVTWNALKCLDVDGDGALELILLGTDGTSGWLYVLDAKTLAIKWQTSQASMGGSLAIANVDAEAGLEIVTSGGYVFDARTHANKWYYGTGFGSQVEAGDVDGDGIAEIVGGGGWASTVKVFSAVLKSPLWEIPTAGYGVGAIKVADLDGKGASEILVCDAQWGSVHGYRYDPQSKAAVSLFQISDQDHGVSGIAVGEVEGDGSRQLVWGSGLTSSGADVMVVASWNPTPVVKWKGPNPQLDGPFTGAKLAQLAVDKSRLMFVTPRTSSGYDGMRIIALDPATGSTTQSPQVDSNWSGVSACDVGDALGTGFDQMLLGTANLYTPCFAVYDFLTGTRSWVSGNVGTPAGVTHADLTGDGVADLIGITTDGVIYAWDVARQSSLWTSTTMSTGRKVVAADLDGDGVPELIALFADQLVVYAKSKSSGSYLETGHFPVTGQDLLVADCDGDGKPEILILQSAYSGTPQIYRLDGRLTLLNSFPMPGAVAIFLEDSGSPRKNLVVSTTSSSYAPTTSSLVAVDPRTGTTVWQSPNLLGTVQAGSLGFYDLDRKGNRQIAFGTGSGMFLTR
jgi:hypothetical protein